MRIRLFAVYHTCNFVLVNEDSQRRPSKMDYLVTSVERATQATAAFEDQSQKHSFRITPKQLLEYSMEQSHLLYRTIGRLQRAAVEGLVLVEQQRSKLNALARWGVLWCTRIYKSRMRCCNRRTRLAVKAATLLRQMVYRTPHTI